MISWNMIEDKNGLESLLIRYANIKDLYDLEYKEEISL